MNENPSEKVTIEVNGNLVIPNKGLTKLYQVMKEHRDLTKWMDQNQWDFFVTLTFDQKFNDTHILHIMEDIESHYLVKGICWFREFTTTGLPHIHMVILSDKIYKSFQKLPLVLKRYGQVDFQLFKSSQGTKGLDYISKMWGKDDNLIWNIKTPKDTNVKRNLQGR